MSHIYIQRRFVLLMTSRRSETTPYIDLCFGAAEQLDWMAGGIKDNFAGHRSRSGAYFIVFKSIRSQIRPACISTLHPSQREQDLENLIMIPIIAYMALFGMYKNGHGEINAHPSLWML